ncbi:formin-1-like isoform X1 [Planococcus citri]|uniref:formin-1-like isoform X1 n=1 Tax=Planococcus citri TaxID=170843 RepID=UPI0031F7D02F
MFRVLTLVLFCNLIGSIISPSEHSDGTPIGQVHGDGHTNHSPPLPPPPPPTPPPPQTGQIIPPNYAAPVPGHIPDPNLHHVPTPSSPPPGPIIDNSLLGILKRTTSYGEPIEKLQKSSTEFWKHLRDYAIQKAQDAAAEKDGHRRDHHEDHWSKVEQSFKKVLNDMGSIGKHNMKQNFKHTDKAISDLRENPHDEHRQGELRKSLVKDLQNPISTLFPSPLPSLGRLYSFLTGGDGVNKDVHGEHHGSKEGQHIVHMGHPPHDPSKDHLGHSGPTLLTSEGNLIHPDHIIRDHEGKEHHHDKDGHSRDRHMDHVNSINHQGPIPPEGSVVQNVLEKFLYYFPIDKFIAYLVTNNKQH